MRTLLIESSTGAGEGAAAALASAGHQVVRCHQAEAPAFPCTDVVIAGSCPLRGDSAADVVLLVRDPADEAPTLAEAGVTCAIRAGVPVAVLGDPAADPFAGWTSRARGDEPVALCREAIELARDEAVLPLRTEVVRMLQAAGAAVALHDVHIDLEQDAGRARMLVTVPAGMPIGHETIATHVHCAFRDGQVNPNTRIIDVAVRSLP